MRQRATAQVHTGGSLLEDKCDDTQAKCADDTCESPDLYVVPSFCSGDFCKCWGMDIHTFGTPNGANIARNMNKQF